MKTTKQKIKTDTNPLLEWQAWTDEEGPCGYGKTEQEAIEDLMEKMEKME